MCLVPQGTPSQRMYPYWSVVECSSNLVVCLQSPWLTCCCCSERELLFVPKKGRPITQCHHCRSERKKKSAHHKCECGEKPHPKEKCKEKCIHLREAEAAAAAAAGTSTTPPINSTVADSIEAYAPASELYQLPEDSSADEHHCCCPHGGKCTCSTARKESSEEGHTLQRKSSHIRPKPRLTSHQSEGHLTVFANGHHKPVHRNNNAAHESGVPYKIPRSHTTNGVTNKSIARRSVDSLASVKSVSPITWRQPTPTPTMANTVPEEPLNAQSERSSPHSDYSANYQSVFDVNRMSIDATAYGMPELSSSVPNTTYQDFGYPSAQSALSVTTTSTEPAISGYSLPASGLESGQDYWSNIDWAKFDSNTFEAQPALTNASSGTISEIDDLPRVDDLNGFDASYSVDNQAQMSNFGTDYFDSSNNNNQYGGNFNFNTNSNRWSMPSMSSQGNNASFLSMVNDPPTKDVPSQTFGMGQPVLQSQPAMSSGSTSAQSQSPAPMASDNMYQNSFPDWDSLIPDYNAASVATSNDGMNDSLGFAVSESTQTPVMSGQTVPLQNDGSGNYDGFDNSYRAMQWDDGVAVPAAPAEQDYINTFNLDPNWNVASFNNPWS